MMNQGTAKTAYVFIMGIFFAVLQTCMFFSMEVFLTSAFAGFGAVTGGWLAGSAVGLFIGRAKFLPQGPKGDAVYLAVCLAAYYGFTAAVHASPFNTSLLPVHFALIAISGSTAGVFFTRNRELFPSASRLYYVENNGFILGWIIGFSGYVFIGGTFVMTGPFIAAFAAIATRIMGARECSSASQA